MSGNGGEGSQAGGSRDDLVRIFRAGVERADPARAVAEAITDDAPNLILGLGKAACAMTDAALNAHPGVPALVVTNPENLRPVPGAEVLTGAHPVPDASSEAAGAALLDRADALHGGRLLCLISGGGSALAVAPAEGLTLADKADATRLMLGGGLEIGAMNLVRQRLSQLKGGGLARAAAPAEVTALILSDVIGDDISAIASGPVTPPLGTPEEAQEVLRQAHLWDAMPPAVRRALQRRAEPDPPPAVCRIVGSNRISLEAMARAAPDAWLDPAPLVGDVADAALRVAEAARRVGTTLWGGETTVTLRGGGRGGRNQELALRVAVALEGMNRSWTFLAAGTDGRDGPTDAAGAVVDGGTLSRIGAAGFDPDQALARNDSYPALDAAGDLLRTGGTGTNVADLAILRVEDS